MPQVQPVSLELSNGSVISLRVQFMPKEKTPRPCTYLVFRTGKGDHIHHRHLRDALKGSGQRDIRLNSKGNIIFASKSAYTRDDCLQAVTRGLEVLQNAIRNGGSEARKSKRPHVDKRIGNSPLLATA